MRYLFIALVFCSCTLNSKRHEGKAISKEVLDTVSAAPRVNNIVPELFETAFISGTTHKVRNSIFSLYGVNIGKLKLLSGRIAACDPLLMEEYGLPFTQQFPVGEFPVQLSIAKFEDEEAVAFARIKFSDEPVVKWEFALLKDQKPIPVGGKEGHGYVVDAGNGCFIDADGVKVFDKLKAADLDSELYKEMDKHFHKTWRYTLYEFGKYNMAAFSTALGDGTYSTYIGFDAKGKPCRLVTDFNLFDWYKH